MPSALALVRLKAGNKRAARIAIMAITTSNSTNVNAQRRSKTERSGGLLSGCPPVNTDIRMCQVPELPKVTIHYYGTFAGLSISCEVKFARGLASHVPSAIICHAHESCRAKRETGDAPSVNHA